jgi:hypothetical protein
MKTLELGVGGLLGMFAASVFGTACANPPSHYTVYISPHFDPPHMQMVLESLDEWESKAANVGLSFDVVIEERMCDESCDNAFSITSESVEEIRRLSGDPNAVGTTYHWTDHMGHEWARVFVPGDEADEEANGIDAVGFSGITQHEVGHGLGLQHTFVPGVSLMFPEYQKAAPHVMCVDVVQYANLRHENNGFCKDD